MFNNHEIPRGSTDCQICFNAILKSIAPWPTGPCLHTGYTLDHFDHIRVVKVHLNSGADQTNKPCKGLSLTKEAASITSKGERKQSSVKTEEARLTKD